MIMTGCVAFAQHTGSARLMEELLPQCWEQVRVSYRSINAKTIGLVKKGNEIKNSIKSMLLFCLEQVFIREVTK